MTTQVIIDKYKKRVRRKAHTLQKKALFSMRGKHANTLPVFIMGCGRSGTTMMLDIFHSDRRIETLGENDPKIATEKFMLRYELLGPAIKQSKAPVLVMKPILNSFDAAKVLTQYRDAKVLWLVRDYKDMIASSMKKFGDRVAVSMREVITGNFGPNWIASGIHRETRRILQDMDSTGFTKLDWMGLVWWSVNRTILVDRLNTYEGFSLIQYEDFVIDQNAFLERIYGIIGLDCHCLGSKMVHANSVGKGSGIQLSPSVEKLCSGLKTQIAAIAICAQG
jgi:hypothetical protein